MVDYFSEDPDDLTSDMRNASCNRSLDIYNTFARLNYQPTVTDLQGTNMLEDKGIYLGNKFTSYLLTLIQSNNKHYSVGTKFGYLRSWLADLYKKKKI